MRSPTKNDEPKMADAKDDQTIPVDTFAGSMTSVDVPTGGKSPETAQADDDSEAKRETKKKETTPYFLPLWNATTAAAKTGSFVGGEESSGSGVDAARTILVQSFLTTCRNSGDRLVRMTAVAAHVCSDPTPSPREEEEEEGQRKTGWAEERQEVKRTSYRCRMFSIERLLDIGDREEDEDGDKQVDNDGDKEESIRDNDRGRLL